MKLRKFLLIILSALSLIALSVSLSACGFIEEILGGEPPTPPAEEQPETPSEDPTTDPGNPSDDDTDGCSHQYGEWTDEINECTLRQVKRTCSLCGDTEYKFVIPNGHDYGEWEDIVNTCASHEQKRVCAVCNGEDFRYLTPNPHNYGEWTDLVNTCTIHTQKRVCSVCLDEEEKSLPTAGHIYGEWLDEVKTCTTHLQKQICSSCGDIKKRALKAQGHKYVIGVCEYCKQSFADGGNDELDKYNGSYGYDYFKDNNLTAQQTLYERIDESARAFHISKDLNAEAVLQNGAINYIVSRITYNDLGLTKEQAISVWKTYKDDNPLYYWLSSQLTYTNSQLNILAVEDYAQGEVRIQTNDFVYNKVSEFSRMLGVDDNAYRKALAFHDKIISVIDYAYDSNGVPQSADWAHNVIGVFEECGAVCEGYAKAFQLLLNYNGVENIFVSGRGNSEEHAWNLVQLDDGEWYWCDLTWDDTPSWEWGISYYYFLVNDTQQVNWRDGGWIAAKEQNFLDSHTPHSPQGTSVQFLYELPARAADAYAEEDGLILRQTFVDVSSTYAVAGYNTVQLVKCDASGAVNVPETVIYYGVTYTVISIGEISEDGLFCDGYVINNWQITSVFVPKTVKFIWKYALYSYTLQSITVSADNEYYCAVDGVLYTKSMKTLVSYPSSRPDSEYHIPEQTSRMAEGAFQYAINLERLYVGKNLVTTGVMCAGSYQDTSKNVSVDAWRIVAQALKISANTAIIIDEEHPNLCSDENFIYNKSKTYIYAHFHSDAKEIYIPQTVEFIYNHVFVNYTSLEKIIVAEGNPSFVSIGGVLYNKDVTEIIYIPLNLKGAYTLPDTVTSIGELNKYEVNLSFVTTHDITELNFSESLKFLGKRSIFWCSKLERINYSGTVEQWLAIEKAEDWFTLDYNQTNMYIYCSDGVVDINGNIITQ